MDIIVAGSLKKKNIQHKLAMNNLPVFKVTVQAPNGKLREGANEKGLVVPVQETYLCIGHPIYLANYVCIMHLIW